MDDKLPLCVALGYRLNLAIERSIYYANKVDRARSERSKEVFLSALKNEGEKIEKYLNDIEKNCNITFGSDVRELVNDIKNGDISAPYVLDATMFEFLFRYIFEYRNR